MKGLDHIVLCVNDLDAAANSYRQSGFTVTPRAQHPFGTHNCIIQLDGFFLELLTVAEPEKIPADQAGQFGFARFNQHYLEQGEGASMLVMDSNDFRADQAAAQKAGLETYLPFEFSRKTTLPGGEVVEVSFGLNFVTNNKIPKAAFFNCQQFNPEYFWNAQYQKHHNGANSIVEICIIAENPAEFAPFMTTFMQCQISNADSTGITIPTARGRVTIVTPQKFTSRYHAPAPNLNEGPLLAGMTIGVSGSPPDPVSKYGVAILFEPVG